MQELRYCRMRVVVSNVAGVPPSPHMCHEVLTMLESCLHQVTLTMFPQLTTVASVKCPCLSSKACSSHKIKRCPDPNCLHLLSLHECLSSSSVWCQYYKVDTSFIKKYFPVETDWLTDSSPRQSQSLGLTYPHDSPSWMRGR